MADALDLTPDSDLVRQDRRGVVTGHSLTGVFAALDFACIRERGRLWNTGGGDRSLFL